MTDIAPIAESVCNASDTINETIDQVNDLNYFLNKSGANLVSTHIPTADPHVVGAIWADSGVLTVSAG